VSAVNFAVGLEQDDGVATLRLSGELDIAVIERLREVRDRALADGPASLVIDLSEVEFIDSSGLKFLLESDRLLRPSACELSLRRPGPAAMKVFSITGVDQHLPFA